MVDDNIVGISEPLPVILPRRLVLNLSGFSC